MSIAVGPSRETKHSHSRGALTRGREMLEDGAFGARMAAYLGGDEWRRARMN